MKRLILSVMVGLLSVSLCSGEPTPTPKPDSAKPTDKPALKAHDKSATEIVFSPSYFEENPRNKATFGKDVFFPRTQRFRLETQENNPNGKSVQDTASLILKNLVLKGVSGVGARRLALLNNRTLAIGEVWDFKLNGQVHRIKCEEIRPHSIVLNIEGVIEKQELQLKTNL